MREKFSIQREFEIENVFFVECRYDGEMLLAIGGSYRKAIAFPYYNNIVCNAVNVLYDIYV